MFSAKQLVDFCEAVFAAKWVYWYGTCGYACAEDLYRRKREQYPGHYGDSRKAGYMADIAAGATCADCVGMIKAFAWKGGDLSAPVKYDGKGTRTGCPDQSANGMYEICTRRGKIDTIPEDPGLCVWRSGHIGVYVGNGYTIEMRGFAYDCQRRKLSDGTWTNWGALPFIDYSGEVKPREYALGDRVLRKGMSGADVRQLQQELLHLNYQLPKYGADADYGSETERAVKQFQADHGLDADGIFGAQSLKALNEELAASRAPEAEDVPEGGSEPAYILTITGDKATLEAIQREHGGELSEIVG